MWDSAKFINKLTEFKNKDISLPDGQHCQRNGQLIR